MCMQNFGQLSNIAKNLVRKPLKLLHFYLIIYKNCHFYWGAKALIQPQVAKFISKNAKVSN